MGIANSIDTVSKYLYFYDQTENDLRVACKPEFENAVKQWAFDNGWLLVYKDIDWDVVKGEVKNKKCKDGQYAIFLRFSKDDDYISLIGDMDMEKWELLNTGDEYKRLILNVQS